MPTFYANNASTLSVDSRAGLIISEVQGVQALQPARKPTRPKDDTISVLGYNVIDPDLAVWGANNLFPQEVLREIRCNDILSGSINWIVKAMSAAKLHYGIELDEIDPATNERRFQRQIIPEVEDWLQCNRIEQSFIPESLMDMKILGNIAPEIILTRDRSKVASLQRIDMSYVRYQRQNEATRMVDTAWVYADWDFKKGLFTDSATQVRVFPPQYDEVNALRQRRGLYKFIYPVSYPKIGRLYYSMAPWHPIIHTGWLQLLNEIPRIKNAYFENSLKLKYHIEIDYRYWEYAIPHFDSLSQEKKIQAKKDKMEEIADIFTAAHGAGKAITTDILFDAHNREQHSLVKLTELKAPVQDGILNQDSQEGANHIYAALNIDSTLVTTVGKNLTGGGSDKRQAWNIFMKLSELEQRLITGVMEFCMHYNGFEGLKFRLVNTLMATMSEVSPQNREITNDE